MIRDFGELVQLARGEYFVREGKICRKLGFIADGVMRYTRFEESGDETTCLSRSMRNTPATADTHGASRGQANN